MITVSEALANWVEKLHFDEIPDHLVKAAKMDILDMLGCGLFGSTRKWVRVSTDLIMEWSGKQEATLWGRECKIPSVNAVFANAHAVNSFEYDDTYVPTGIHPGALVVTSALAAAEMKGGVDGHSFVEAVVAGHEVSARVRSGLGWSILHGWNSTAICSTFGAAAAAAKILGLDSNGIADAFGITGPSVGGLLTYGFGAMAKRVVNARAAQGGFWAALLASRGFTGYRDILESKQGGFLSAHSPDFALDNVTQGLGRRYEMDKLALKKYPCCTSFHAAVDALSEILERHTVSPDMIQRVLVNTTSGALKNNCMMDYDNLSSAQMSMEYAVGAMLLDGELSVEQYSDERISDERFRKFVGTITTCIDPNLDSKGLDSRMAAKVDIVLKDGKTLESSYVVKPKEMTQDALYRKFRKLASYRVSGETAEAILEKVSKIEQCSEMIELANLLY